MISAGARAVLGALVRLADGAEIVAASYAEIMAGAGVSRNTVAVAIATWENLGAIEQKRGFRDKATYRLRREAIAGFVGAPGDNLGISPAGKVSTSNSLIVYPYALIDDKKEDKARAWADFADRVAATLSEWRIVGSKAVSLTAALVALARTRGPDTVYSEMRAARVGALQRARKSPAGLTVKILEGYAATGQIPLFETAKTDTGRPIFTAADLEFNRTLADAYERHLAAAAAIGAPEMELQPLRAKLAEARAYAGS